MAKSNTLSRVSVAQVVALVAEHGQRGAARILKCSHKSVQNKLRKVEAPAPVNDNAPEPVVEKVEPYRIGGTAADREVVKLAAEVTRLKKELQLAHRSTLDEDSIRELIGTLAVAPVEPFEFITKANIAPGLKTPEVPVLMLADWHAGENVSKSEVNGVNEYSPAIMERRVGTLLDNARTVAFEHGPGRYEGAVIPLVGDFVSGGLHPELLKTDEEDVLPSVLRVRDMLVSTLRETAKMFGKVYVPAVAGNHGRHTAKPEFKRYVYKNFDWLIYQLLQREFEGDDRIRIDVRPANEVYFRVHALRFLLTHGDMLGVKGGDGIIGSIGPIMRGEVKTRGRATSSGLPYDMLLMGHWHQELWLPRAIVSNTLKGYDEYAQRQLGATPTAPSQSLFFVHPRIGITSRWSVLVDDPAARPAADWVSVFDPAVL